MNQFTYKQNDHYTFQDIDNERLSRLLALLVIIEADHPGTMQHILRILSFIVDGWLVTSSVSNPEHSMDVQLAFDEFLDTI